MGPRLSRRRRSNSDLRRLTRLLIVSVLVLAPATSVAAKSFWLTSADVDVVVNSDGSLMVTEIITFKFSGRYTGAYRDIPLGPGESVTVVSVADEMISYSLGGCTELGCSSPAGTYGVAQLRDFVRIGWHHSSSDEERTFTLRYGMTGLATAYDDVVDVNLQVWGDQWAVGLDRLTAQMDVPGAPSEGDVRIWGHPTGVTGSVSSGDDGVSPSLEASKIPAEHWVEMRVVFPTKFLSSTAGTTVVDGEGLQLILNEEARFADDAEAAARAGRTGLIWGVSLAIVVAVGLGGMVYLLYGREPRVDYDREYEQEPPSDLSPAEVGALLSQGAVTEREFTATMFDLILKGAIEANPAQVERVTWGGLKKESITDLVLSLTDKATGFRDFEQPVLTVVRRVLELGPRPLHEFREGIREDASANAETYQHFRERVLGAVQRNGMLDTSGRAAAWLVGFAALALVFGSFFVLPQTLRGRPGGATISVLIIAGMVVGSVALFILLSFRRVRAKRSKEGALEAARWEAFRRYLTVFSRLKEAPPISIDLWDRFLIYAIVFGIAEEVLTQARLHAPPELESRSPIYWYGSHGYSGGHTANAFVGIQSALSGAFRPPSSGGGGGGFSGGGGRGGGGGGGGAW